ncbi:hypothetical protein GGF46_004019 [Coemansia sp. RSA 552]|nr:hypothetical protein GGF46_004019 [Coemansia sp. RSA 552]
MSTAFLGGGCAGLAGGRDGRIRLFDTRVPERQHSKLHGLLGTLNYNHKSSIHGLGAEDVMLVSASMDGEVNVWDLRMGNSSLAPSPRPVTKLSSPSRMPSACRLGFAVEQGKVIAAGCDSQVRIWSLHSGQQLHVIPLPAVQGSCTALALKQPGNGGPPGLFLAQSDSIVIVGDHTRDEPQSGPR